MDEERGGGENEGGSQASGGLGSVAFFSVEELKTQSIKDSAEITIKNQ